MPRIAKPPTRKRAKPTSKKPTTLNFPSRSPTTPQRAKYIDAWLSSTTPTPNPSPPHPRPSYTPTPPQQWSLFVRSIPSSPRRPSRPSTHSRTPQPPSPSPAPHTWTKTRERLRTSSYDSRHSLSNSHYELDSFVVDSSPSCPSPAPSSPPFPQRSASESTTYPRSTTTSTSPPSYSYPLAPSPLRARARACASEIERDIDAMFARHTTASSRSTSASASVLTHAEDVIEEVSDAIALFGRRCNAMRPPVIIAFRSGLVGDSGVREVLDEVVRRGMGRGLGEARGVVEWIVRARRGWGSFGGA
ncbi:hypothetical protein EJ04DRAFT_579135 [Polyplosphaeria fusca]|uniref:Uncharacterized protein n=1 Tax=Polyplosphaeria fusca TaxID=682080 RepID=A0A9P4QUU2_9PLEO|nr:hypothetical protein EJ04DRAFT_579135 [Polyplosphaeria fusca]